MPIIHFDAILNLPTTTTIANKQHPKYINQTALLQRTRHMSASNQSPLLSQYSLRLYWLRKNTIEFGWCGFQNGNSVHRGRRSETALNDSYNALPVSKVLKKLIDWTHPSIYSNSDISQARIQEVLMKYFAQRKKINAFIL